MVACRSFLLIIFLFYIISEQEMCDQSAPKSFLQSLGKKKSRRRMRRKNYTLYNWGYFTASDRNKCVIGGGITRSRRKATNGADLHGRRRPKGFHATDGTRRACHASHSHHQPFRCAVGPRLRQSPNQPRKYVRRQFNTGKKRLLA